MARLFISFIALIVKYLFQTDVHGTVYSKSWGSVSWGVGPRGIWGLVLSVLRGKRDACWVVQNTRVLLVSGGSELQSKVSLNAVFGELDEKLCRLLVCGVSSQK